MEMQSDSVYVLSYVTEVDDDAIVYCLSNEDAITVHPVDATWQCEGSHRRPALAPQSHAVVLGARYEAIHNDVVTIHWPIQLHNPMNNPLAC